MVKDYDRTLKFLLLVMVFLESRNEALVTAKNENKTGTWEGSKYQIECTMCSGCDNPCNTPSPPPPSPSPPPPTTTTAICPPPPSPPSSGNYYNSPPPPTSYYYPPPPPSGGGGGGGGGFYKPPPQYPTGQAPPLYPTGQATPPPNPIVPYFPYYYHIPPPPSSSPSLKIPLTFFIITMLFSSVFY